MQIEALLRQCEASRVTRDFHTDVDHIMAGKSYTLAVMYRSKPAVTIATRPCWQVLSSENVTRPQIATAATAGDLLKSKSNPPGDT
eukprot:1159520-Pelagomonas_calceolata.AAC.3